ncbi:hypothetical protein C8Q70DRAFT_50194 [Cubamyces menziesii]|nr:hypothetical protein C8Q70DRAFT_50194 [Cubamyces menziesii]
MFATRLYVLAYIVRPGESTCLESTCCDTTVGASFPGWRWSTSSRQCVSRRSHTRRKNVYGDQLSRIYCNRSVNK